MKTLSIAQLAHQHSHNPNFKEQVNSELHHLKRQVLDFMKFLYLVFILVLILCALVELKNMFNVDIFPGIDTPVDNLYFAGKAEIGKLF